MLIFCFGGLAVIHGLSGLGTLVAFVSGFQLMSAPAWERCAHCRFFEQSRIQQR